MWTLKTSTTTPKVSHQEFRIMGPAQAWPAGLKDGHGCTGMLEDDSAGALKGFQEVVSMEQQKAEW